MKTAMRSAAMALLVIGCGLGTAAQSACRYVKVGILEVELEGGQPVVAGHVNEHPVRAALSTGSHYTSIDPATAEAAKLSLRHTRFESLGRDGAKPIYRAQVDDIGFGPLNARRFNLVVADRGGALLGADVLMQADLELSLADRQLRLFRPDGCGEAFLAYWDENASVLPMLVRGPGDRRAVVEVLLNGKPVQALISTGTPVSVVDRATALRVGLTPPQDVDGPWPGRFDSLEIGNESIRNPQLLVADRWKAVPRSALNWAAVDMLYEIPGVILGMDFLASHRVLVASSQRRVYLSYLGGTLFSTEAPR